MLSNPPAAGVGTGVMLSNTLTVGVRTGVRGTNLRGFGGSKMFPARWAI
jgi:hypothetical protein